MSIETRHIDLPALGPGTSTRLQTHTFSGTASPRSAYIQAGLHADEHPGLLVVQHLLARLTELHQTGKVLGQVVICPFANPLGMTQNVLGFWTGRFNLANGENFNRHFPDMLPALASQRDEADLSPAQRLQRALAEQPAHDPVAALRQALLGEALRHDLVLDLHCDTAGILHLYANRQQQQRALQLAECLGIEVVFLEDAAGGQPFDEACNRPWNWLVEQGLADPTRRPFAASIELRGQADVDDDLARADAEGILRFLASEGLLQLDDVSMPATRSPQVYPLEGASHLPSPGHGLLAWKKQPGDAVSRGELIAELVPLDAPPGTPRTPIHSDVDGMLVVRPLFKLVRGGQRVALLAGTTALAQRQAGQLLHNF